MVILLTNDDGADSIGLKYMKEALEEIGEVWVFATLEDRSGSSHSITLTHSIRIIRLSERMFGIDGTPTDCVNIAVNGIMPYTPDIVVSGINLGENVGDDTLYSGTFGGAIEGSLLGITSFAISARVKEGKTGDLKVIAEISKEIMKVALDNPPPKRVVININFPFFRKPEEIKGVKYGKLCRRVYGEKALHFQDPRGRDFWFIGGKELKVDANGVQDISNLDVFLLDRGYISITPVKVEFMTEKWVDERKLYEVVMKGASRLVESREEP